MNVKRGTYVVYYCSVQTQRSQVRMQLAVGCMPTCSMFSCHTEARNRTDFPQDVFDEISKRLILLHQRITYWSIPVKLATSLLTSDILVCLRVMSLWYLRNSSFKHPFQRSHPFHLTSVACLKKWMKPTPLQLQYMIKDNSFYSLLIIQEYNRSATWHSQFFSVWQVAGSSPHPIAFSVPNHPSSFRGSKAHIYITCVWWSKFSQKHNYKYMAKLCQMSKHEYGRYRPKHVVLHC